MIIKENEIAVSHLENFKGGEKHLESQMYFDGTNRILTRAKLVPGASIGMHTHEDSCEVIFILEGHGTIVEIAPAGESCDAGESAPAQETATPVGPGDCLYCPKGHTHSLRNTSAEGDLVFYAVVPMQ